MNDLLESLNEAPEEKAFFDSKGTTSTPPPAAPEPAKEAEPAAAPEPVAEQPKAVAQPEPEKHQKTMVPLAVMLEERAKFERRINELAAKVNQVAPPAPEPLNVDEKPIEVIKDLVEFKQQTLKQQQEQAEIQAIADFGQRHAAEFMKEKPDFNDAYQHLRVSRAQQLIDAGEVQTPQELNQRIIGEEKEIIAMCARMRIDPARFMYNLAGAAGYAAQQAAAAAVDANAAQSAAAIQSAPAAAAAAPKPSAEEKIKMAAEGQSRAQSSAKAPAGAGGPLDLRALTMLDDDEFDKATSDKNWKKMWN